MTYFDQPEFLLLLPLFLCKSLLFPVPSVGIVGVERSRRGERVRRGVGSIGTRSIGGIRGIEGRNPTGIRSAPPRLALIFCVFNDY